MVKIHPSLMFAGACGDAFRRYTSLFGGEIVFMLTYGESAANSFKRGSPVAQIYPQPVFRRGRSMPWRATAGS